MLHNMKLQLLDWKVKQVSLSPCEGKRDKGKAGFALGNGLTDDPFEFTVGFKVSVEEKYYDLEVEMLFRFKSDCEIQEEFLNTDFATINAPAIAFPYVRSFMSILTLQAGYEPLNIPSINFVKLAESRQDTNKNQ